jgi:hypothetical protein
MLGATLFVYQLTSVSLMIHFFMESLILAQDERWRRGLGMQVERRTVFGSLRSGERVSNT